jgi:hypothetical protein
MSLKLTESEVAHWKMRVGVARTCLEPKIAKWKQSIDRYANRNLPQILGGADDEVHVNVLFANVRTKVPHLFFRNPDVMVIPEQEDYVEGAALAEAVLRHYMRIGRMKQSMNRSVLDSLLMPYGIQRLGYTVRTVRNSDPVDEADANWFEKLTGGKLPKQRKSAKETSILTGPPRVSFEGPTCDRVSPMNFITHPDARFPLDEGARWVGQIGIRTMREVQFDERLPKSWRKNLKPSHNLDFNHYMSHTPASSYRDLMDPEKMDDPDMMKVVFYEIWDRLTRRYMLFAENNWDEGPARVENWFFDGMEGFPFEFLVPLEIPDEFEGLSELDPIIMQVEELDRFRTYQIRHLKRANRKYLAGSDLPEDQLRALEIGEDCVIIRARTETVEGQLIPIQDAAIPNDFYAAKNDIREDINVISATTQFDQGQVVGAKTATEASIIETGSRARVSFSEDQVVDFLGDVLTKKFQIAQQWLPDELVVRVTGDKIGKPWRAVTPEDIAGQYTVQVVAGSTNPPNRDLLRTQAQNVFSMWMGSPLVDQRELHLMVGEHFPELMSGGRLQRMLKNPGGELPQLPPELQAALAEEQGGGAGLTPSPEMLQPSI